MKIKHRIVFLIAITFFISSCNFNKKPSNSTVSEEEKRNYQEIKVSETYDLSHLSEEEKKMLSELSEADKIFFLKASEEKQQKIETQKALFRPETWRTAQEALKKLPEFDGKEIMINGSIYFMTNTRISIDIVNPDTTEYIDNYAWEKNKWSKSPAHKKGSKDRVPLSEIDFGIAASLFHTTDSIRRTELDNAEPLSSGIHFSASYNEREFFTSLNSPRKRMQIYFDEKGNVKSKKTH